MHRIARLDGTYTQSKFIRWAATISYALFAAAGAVFIAADILIPAYGVTAEVMAWFMVLGALCSAFGAVTVRWVGEFAGLPLLGTAMVGLGIEIWWYGRDNSPWLALANGLLLLAVAGIMVTRWRQVLAIYLLAHWLATKGPDRE